MSAAGSPEQSAKRVVSKCGLMGLSAAVFQSRRQANMIQWLRRQERIYIDPMRMPKKWMEWSGNDFWDTMQYALLSKHRNKNLY